MKTEVAPAVVVLGQNSLAVARQIIQILPTATLYGLANRTTGVDVSFTNFGDYSSSEHPSLAFVPLGF